MKAKDICLIAILSATLTAGKMALSFIANVEVVTLFLVVYALTLPRSRVLIASVTFVLTEILLYGPHIWIIMYLIHWPTLVLIVSFLKGRYAPMFAVIIGVVMTALFGVQTTVLEVLFLTNYPAIGFFKCFMLRYSTGVPFFITHIVSNACILTILVYPMYRLMHKLALRYFSVKPKKKTEAAQPTELQTPLARKQEGNAEQDDLTLSKGTEALKNADITEKDSQEKLSEH